MLSEKSGVRKEMFEDSGNFFERSQKSVKIAWLESDIIELAQQPCKKLSFLLQISVKQFSDDEL